MARSELNHQLNGVDALGRIFQSCPVALGLATIGEGRIIDVNERWLSLFGYQRDEVIGRTNAELGISAESGRREALVTQARASGVVRDAEMKVRRKTGEVRDIIVSVVPVDTTDDGDIWIFACVEITDRKQHEAEREQLLAREQIARAEAEHALEQLRAVYAITDIVSTPASIGAHLSELLRRLRNTLQTDHASVMILDDATQSLHLRAIEGPEPGRTVPRMRIPLGAGVSGRIAAEGKPMIVDDYSTIDIGSYERTDLSQLAQTRSVMGAPFRIADRVAGVVVVSCQTPRKFTEEDLRLLLLAVDRVAPAIERGRLIASIRTGVDRQRALSRRLLTVQEDERRRIAVELHDELGQILTAVKINLESIERAPDPQRLASLPTMIKGVDDALQRVKDMALDLRPSVLDDLGLDAALRWFTDRCAQRAGFAAHLSVDTLPPLEANLQTACFRVTQEALTNVERHARAQHVWIDLHVLDGALELSVRDDGAGFDVAAAKARAISGSSVGILGMQERVALTGGDYDIVQVASGGTEVRARFPLNGGLAN